MNRPVTAADDPHRGQPAVAAGRPLERAEAAMILLHGRGASAEDILHLAAELERPDFAYLAPQAAGHTWYPYSFLAPLEQNEPYLSSALRLVGATVDRVLAAGIPSERLLLLGFSQGACLALEFTARNPRHYGGVAALTGGLIGPDGTPRDYPGSLAGTDVFLGTADPDPHVPRSRVEESARVLERMGARVTVRIYPGMGHTVNQDELDHVRSMMERVAERPGSR
jgi:predicted esterase